MKKNLLKKGLVAGLLMACGIAMLNPKASADEQAQVQLTINPGLLTIGIDSGVLANLELRLSDLTVSNSVQVVTGHFGADAFWLSDQKGAEAGYYTTVQVSDLLGSNNHKIDAQNVKLKSTSVRVITGENENVTIGLSNSNFTTANTALTYFQRPVTSTAQAGVLGVYGDDLQIEVTVPGHTVADTYTGTITYTLFEDLQPTTP